MITNKQILDIITKKEEYERKLECLKAAEDVCKYFNEGNAVAGIRQEYNQVIQEYEQWLDLEVQ